MVISHENKFIFFCPVGECATSSIQAALNSYHDEPRILLDEGGEKCVLKGLSHRHNKEGTLTVDKHIAPETFFEQTSKLKGFPIENIKKYLKFAVTRNPWDWVLAVFNKNYKNALTEQMNRKGVRAVQNTIDNIVAPLKIDSSVKLIKPNGEIVSDVDLRETQSVYDFSSHTSSLKPYPNSRESLTDINEKGDPIVMKGWAKTAVAFCKNSLGGKSSQYEIHCDTDNKCYIDVFLPFENLEESFFALMSQQGLQGLQLPHKQNNFNEAQKNYQSYYTTKAQHIVNQAFQKDIDTFHYTFS